VLDCLDETEGDGWEFVTEAKGVRVHRKFLPSIDGRVSKYCCVKVKGPCPIQSDHRVRIDRPSRLPTPPRLLCQASHEAANTNPSLSSRPPPPQATGVIDASPRAITQLFEDNSRVAEYNKFYAEGRDLEDINENTKVGGESRVLSTSLQAFRWLELGCGADCVDEGDTRLYHGIQRRTWVVEAMLRV
jgi:hypothetical protein